MASPKTDYERTPDGYQRILDANLKVEKALFVPVLNSPPDLNNNPDEAGAIGLKNDLSGIIYYNGTDWLLTDAASQALIASETTAREAADTTLQNAKVDKVTGLGLSSNDYTSAEKTKLSNISEHFVGVYASAGALNTAHPTGLDGQYATVETIGTPGLTYIWDTINNQWVPGNTGAVTSVNSLTGAVNINTDNIGEGSTNQYFTAARVIAAILTGITFGTVSAITSADSVLSAFGKIQSQITKLFAQSIPAGGSTGQILGKNSATDYDTAWIAGTAIKDYQLMMEPIGVNEVTFAFLNAGNITSAAAFGATNVKLKTGISGVYPGGTQTYPYSYASGDRVYVTFTYSDLTNSNCNLILTCKDN